MSTNVSKKGVYLVFVPILLPSGSVESFELFLLNQDLENWTYSIEHIINQESYYSYEGSLPSNQFVDIAIIALFDLNTASTIHLQLNNKRGGKNTYSFSPKPNKLFKRKQSFTNLNKEGYYIEVYSINEASKKRKESPKKIKDKKVEVADIEKLKESWSRKSGTRTKVVMSQAVGDEIDLHIEAFFKEHEKLTPEEILPIQLNYMEECLDNAIANNAYQITFIHGIGNGILKKAIFDTLTNHTHVRSFENRFDSRYGFGATEVLLK